DASSFEDVLPLSFERRSERLLQPRQYDRVKYKERTNSFALNPPSAGFRELPSATCVSETRGAPAMGRSGAKPCPIASSVSPVAAERGRQRVELLATTSVRWPRPLPTRPNSAGRCTNPLVRSAG